MAKAKPGLPEGFEIKLESPAQLGDYLDETYDESVAKAYVAKQRPSAVPAPPAVEPIAARTPALPVQPSLAPPQQLPVPQREPNFESPRQHDQVLRLDEARRRTSQRLQVQKRPERIQFNLRPETQKMFAEIVEFVQRYSLQDDAKASEILDALISVLHQSREELAFHDVPRRGKWGTPTARAFPTALGNAFARAIAGTRSKSERGE